MPPHTEIDTIFTRENRYDSEKMLADLNIPYQINVYGGVDHGFALRADLSVKKNLYAMEDAFGQAVSWFKNWL
jgi:dienelactone hydrolase